MNTSFLIHYTGHSYVIHFDSVVFELNMLEERVQWELDQKENEKCDNHKEKWTLCY